MSDAWTEDRIGTLKIMWLGGSSAAEIMRELGGGVSRSAVLGKVHRLKLPKRSPLAIRTESRSSKRGNTGGMGQPKAAGIISRAKKSGGGGRAFKIAQARKDGLTGEEAMDAVLGTPTVEPVETIVDDQPVISLLELTVHTCRWPIGDPLEPGFGFCGSQVEEGNVYCPMHHRRGTILVRATRDEKVHAA